MTIPSREGQRLGNYHLNRLLGKGAFAEVYLGEHLYLKNYAAIKLLHASLTENDEQLFLSEAQTIAQLTHPNIVRVREFAIERSIPFLVMDYAPGGTLRQRYPKGTYLSLERTVNYVKQIAAALQYAHNQGIIHRDVKPENIFLGAEQVMLGDFGISVHAPKPNTITSQDWAGTLPYMAPEQFQANTVFATDQYALAVLVYEWLCGVRPFEGSAAGLAYQHGNVLPPRLREKDPSLPESVETVVLKALSKKPQDRYVSIINFARALERAVQDSSYEMQPDAETDAADSPHATRSRRIFLSHATLDDMASLQKDLAIRDISVRDDAVPELQEEKTRQDIRAAQAILLALTPHTRSSATVKEHLRIADLYRRNIISIWLQGENLQDLLPAGAEQAMILDARGPRYKQGLDELVTQLERADRGATRVETLLPVLGFEPRNPYKGLRAFTQNDRADFFGRESVVQELLALVKTMVRADKVGAPAPRFLAVVGPSGSGKSSIVMAGLLPRIQDGALPGSAEWMYLNPMVPGKQPLEALAHLLDVRLPEKDPQSIREVIGKEGGFGLHQLSLALISQPETRVVLMIDQFEELFSSEVSEQERLHFIQILVTAATEPQGPVIVLLTLRADFYDRPFAYPALGRLIQQQQCAILPMSVEDLREVIERPAFLPDVRLIFDEDLVGDLLFDLRGQIGALPLLEFALDQLFAHRRERRLTRYAYQEIGGVRGALSNHAESTYTELSSEEQRQLARTLFVRLVQSGTQGQEPLRRRADSSEFVLESSEQTRLLSEVIDTFIAARLITVNQLATVSTLEISHEALIREWPRLATWLQEARADMHLQQTMSSDVREWAVRGKPKDRLYRGSQLKESLTWQGRNTASEKEIAFLRASTARRSRARISLVLVALLLFAILVPAGIFLQQQYAPLTVTTLADDMPGSLRQVVANARAGSTITIDPGLKGTLVLNKSLVMSKDLTLRGPGVGQLTLRGTRDQGYLIYVLQHATVTISQLTFSDPTAGVGSVIKNEGALTLNDCRITGNTQTSIVGKGSGGIGAGIENNGGVLTLLNSSVSHNTVTAATGSFGGGIGSNGGSLIIKNSQIVDNTVTTSDQYAGGGGISSTNTQITLIDSLVARNKVIGGQKTLVEGGGISSGEDTITLTNSSVSNNSVEANNGLAAGGGMVSVGSSVILNNSSITSNTIVGKGEAEGGAISAYKGSITSNKSTLSNNSVTGNGLVYGGGIAAAQNARITLTSTTLTHNSLKSVQNNAAGGGIYSAATLTITDSLIAENSVDGSLAARYGAIGGGIDTQGTLTLSRTTIAQNMVTNNKGGAVGGGLFIYENHADVIIIGLTNCTITGNKVQGSTGSKGGGLAMHGSRSSIDFCTITGNSAASNGGGIDVDQLDTSDVNELTVKNSIVAENQASTASDIAGSITTGGYNLVQSFTGVTINDPMNLHKTDILKDNATNVNIDAQLHNNGGSTPTLALQVHSSAIDAIPALACDVTTDQRGVRRPQHNACDVGAYEYN